MRVVKGYGVWGMGFRGRNRIKSHTLRVTRLILLAVAARVAPAQSIGNNPPLIRTTPPGNITRATKVTQSIVLDGRDDDDAWRDAIRIEEFRQVEPDEAGEPAFPTSARVVYDEKFLYVFVRAHDPHPDS